MKHLTTALLCGAVLFPGSALGRRLGETGNEAAVELPTSQGMPANELLAELDLAQDTLSKPVFENQLKELQLASKHDYSDSLMDGVQLDDQLADIFDDEEYFAQTEYLIDIIKQVKLMWAIPIKMAP
ncbi:hypothetical protein THAOC_32978 [Thalassiosira oceanica]|uniref:Uncharacterized protein n=1 Tax=Thalassiosira oceanica TaxID=159749 RepID=K0RH74_THAOC|nr:hypothetical protein THAOC_32978 [Thalassiosira oceanica]|eukprot:EJK48241.1 hypothetical protein THAOC_32978 [Thalassiosira oceanica]